MYSFLEYFSIQCLTQVIDAQSPEQVRIDIMHWAALAAIDLAQSGQGFLFLLTKLIRMNLMMGYFAHCFLAPGRIQRHPYHVPFL